MKIIGFEGLFSYFPGYVRNGLLVPLAKKYPKLTWTDHSWFFGNPAEDKNAIVVGHSFGGDRALDFANKNAVKACVVLDPRKMWTGSGNLSPTPKVPTYCFYRTGTMRGYPVSGAVNVDLGSDVRHVAVPYQKEVFDLLCRLLEG